MSNQPNEKQKNKTAVLLVNLGTPDSPSVPDVRRYLREFLMDKRVIDIPFINRWLLVNLIIALFRAPKSAAIYRKVWRTDGSPLKTYGYALEKLLQNALGDDYDVKLAMRYQNPSIASVLAQFQQKKYSSMVVLPLFPQYASATTGSVHDEVMRVVRQWQVIPEIRFINQFFENPRFINGFVQNATKFITKTNYDHFVFSYHGLPERQIVKTYPEGHDCTKNNCRTEYHDHNRHCYVAQCFATTRLLAAQLQLTPTQYSTCFQSRLGKAIWIQPYTEDIVTELAEKGIKKVLAFSPAFVADCLETTVEVGEEYADMFKEAGGEQWDLVESLNDSPDFAGVLAEIVGQT